MNIIQPTSEQLHPVGSTIPFSTRPLTMDSPSTRKLKVLHLTASLRMGGAERLIYELVRHLDRQEIEPFVYAFGSFSDDSMLTDFENLALPIHIFPSEHFYNIQVWKDLYQYIRQNKIDLIHTHLCDGDIIGRLISRWMGIPVVSTLQNLPNDFEHYRIDRRLLARFTAMRSTDHLIAVSKLIRQAFIDEWHLPEQRVSSVYNAVDLKPYLGLPIGQSHADENSPLVITNVARHTPQKSQRVLLEAFGALLQHYPNCQLWLVGDGELRNSLEVHATELGLQNNVNFLGIRRDIPAIMAETDLFVLSSDWEGLPLAAVEAMAAAKAVVLTDVGGNSELVENQINGLLVPPQNPNALSLAMLDLCKNPALRQRLGVAARQTARESFDITKVAKQYTQIYRDQVFTQKQPAQEAFT